MMSKDPIIDDQYFNDMADDIQNSTSHKANQDEVDSDGGLVVYEWLVGLPLDRTELVHIKQDEWQKLYKALNAHYLAVALEIIGADIVPKVDNKTPLDEIDTEVALTAEINAYLAAQRKAFKERLNG